MAGSKSWTLPARLRPKPELLAFDVEAALRSMVLLRAEIPEDAFTAGPLGVERVGHGAVIESGGRKVVLTIGYLITEAESVWITTHDNQVVEAHALAYDYSTGFGLVQPLRPLDLPPLPRGSAAALEIGHEVTVLGHGGLSHSLTTRLIARREFAGYWEYLLEDALYTAPVHPLWGGSAMLDNRGRLVAIGSLLVQQQDRNSEHDANLFVPVDTLEPVLEDLLRYGMATQPPRPWLGVYSSEESDRVVIAGLIARGPAHEAGISLGDTVMAVAGAPVDSIANFYRAVWSQGPAGTPIRLTVLRDEQPVDIVVKSANRLLHLKQPQRH